MSIDFTRPNLFRALLYFLLLYLLFRSREWFVAEPAVFADVAMGSPGVWLAGFFENHPVWKEIFLFVVMFSTAFSITRILSRNLIYLERTFVPVMIYPLVALGYSSSPATPVVALAALLLVFAVDNIIKAYKQEANSGFFLNASVALGTALLIYPAAVVFFFLLPVGFILFRQSWRSVIVALFGYFFPIALYSYIQWGMGYPFMETAVEMFFAILRSDSGGGLFRMGIWEYVLSGFFLFLTVFALIEFFRGQTKIRRRTLRGFVTFSWTLLFALSLFALPCRSVDMFPLLAVPLAAVIPAAFNRKSGWFPNLLYILMIWIVLSYNLVQFFPIF